jgi:hypothetical protein
MNFTNMKLVVCPYQLPLCLMSCLLSYKHIKVNFSSRIVTNDRLWYIAWQFLDHEVRIKFMFTRLLALLVKIEDF